MTLDEVRKIRSVIDYFPNYKILEDVHIENDEILMKVSITINCYSAFVPKVSEWYIVFSSLKEIDFYPAKENSIFATFPHQAYNTDCLNYSYRSGKPCLDMPEHALNLPNSYYPYYNGSLFAWYLDRMLNWLIGAATNSLFKHGDPYEVPTTNFVNNELIYKESNIADWSDFNYGFGYATLKVWSNGIVAYYILERFSERGELESRIVNWGDISKQFKAINNKKAIWVTCKNFPIEEPWQYPTKWEKLLYLCNDQNIDLLNIVSALLWQNDAYKFNDFYLILVCPIPEKHGEASKTYYYIMCDIPKITFPRNGFRKNKQGFKSYLNNILKGSIKWHKTNNWDDSSIRTRGIVQEKLREFSYIIIGAGALGGYVCEFLSRQGIKHVKIIDGDRLQVGNLSRHILTINDLGKKKSQALAERLELNSPSIKVQYKEEYLNENNLSFLYDCDIIIDCTGNNDVVDLLSSCKFDAEKHIFIGAFTYGAKGFSFFKQYANTLNSKLYYEKTSDFFNQYVNDIKEGLVMEGIGCYHPVFPALDSDVSLWSSIFVKEIVTDLENPKKCTIKAFKQSYNGSIEITINETIQV